jgi:glycosyltransferase involved in cell wall biosynthesis
MKRLGSLFFIICFWPIFILVKTSTAFLTLVRFKSLLALAHRSLGLTNRVLYLEVFFPENAGYHYRTHKWVEALNRRGFRARARHVFGKRQLDRLLEGRTLYFHLAGMMRRIAQCVSAAGYNCVIVRRELLLFNDYGNLFMERFLLALHPNVILDFDDDISAAKREPRRVSPYGRLMLESPSKFRDSLGLYNRFIAGSDYLKRYALGCNGKATEESAIVIPTCVDYCRHAPKSYDGAGGQVSFGWIGTNGNLGLLDLVIPSLNDIAKDHDIRLVVISGRRYRAEADFEIVNLPWSLATEVDDLRRIDIGLMPLAGTDEDKGKCGFKLLQYMGLGIVSIASAVTANEEIMGDAGEGRAGFLVRSQAEWEPVIRRALANRAGFQKIGEAARARVREKFSHEAHEERYVEFLKARGAEVASNEDQMGQPRIVRHRA